MRILHISYSLKGLRDPRTAGRQAGSHEAAPRRKTWSRRRKSRLTIVTAITWSMVRNPPLSPSTSARLRRGTSLPLNPNPELPSWNWQTTRRRIDRRTLRPTAAANPSYLLWICPLSMNTLTAQVLTALHIRYSLLICTNCRWFDVSFPPQNFLIF